MVELGVEVLGAVVDGARPGPVERRDTSKLIQNSKCNHTYKDLTKQNFS